MANNSDVPLSKILPNNYIKLINCLKQDNSWMKVAQFLNTKFSLELCSQKKISSLSGAMCPAEFLLKEISEKMCTVEDLKFILKECKLYDAFLSISKAAEPMEILQQPKKNWQQKKLNIKIGDPLELEFNVTGIPQPKFEWFKDNEPLVDQVHSVLFYDNFLPSLRGNYVCIATQEYDSASNQKLSEVITVEPVLMSCKLLKEPDKFIRLCEGSPIFIETKVIGYPEPQYQWVHENCVLSNETQSILFIKRATHHNGGQYRCLISNGISEIVVKVKVVIYKENLFEVYNEPVSDKIALLVGNSDYENFYALNAASNDVSTIGQILNSLDFKIICLQNLNQNEMLTAIDILANLTIKNSYILFYYVGHGFELGDKFLLPTDCPNVHKYKKSDAVPESLILNKIMEKQPALFVFLLDMCLKLPNNTDNAAIFDETFHPYQFQSNRNLIKGYSTTSHLVSYETNKDDNGIYVNILKEYLDKDLPILTILGKVNAEISVKCPDQMPSILHNTAQDFLLNVHHEDALREYNLCCSLCFDQDEFVVGNAYVRLQQFKKVFNNACDIIISNAKNIEYNTNMEIPIKELRENNSTILRIYDLQKLEESYLIINLNIDGQFKKIEKRIQISDLFVNI